MYLWKARSCISTGHRVFTGWWIVPGFLLAPRPLLNTVSPVLTESAFIDIHRSPWFSPVDPYPRLSDNRASVNPHLHLDVEPSRLFFSCLPSCPIKMCLMKPPDTFGHHPHFFFCLEKYEFALRADNEKKKCKRLGICQLQIIVPSKVPMGNLSKPKF
jgi:hypothetical protein